MSKEINNRAYRQQVIKDLLSQLHAGKSVDEVKAQFAQAFDGVSGAEISAAEQALIDEGLPVEEVQRLCDVHASVFKGALEDIHKPADASESPGHPAHTLQLENRAIEALLRTEIRPGLAVYGEQPSKQNRLALSAGLTRLAQIKAHYQRKENLIFPLMERYGITAPPKVMWGVDDEIRALIKQASALLDQPQADAHAVRVKGEEAAVQIEEMIFKEENILLPMLLETLTLEEWQAIADESDELGYCLIDPPPAWTPAAPAEETAIPALTLPQDGRITLPTGALTLDELTRMLDTLPIDITFVDRDDTVRYFSQGAERVFPRTKAVIGRKVANCHPPASVHIVEGILADFKSGKKDHEDFWIRMGGKFVFIRYFALRDAHGEYLGTLEVTQDIAPIQSIEGEKRLVSG